MNHLDDDRLLLLAYGEVPEPEAAEMEGHLAVCPDCHARFVWLERSRVAALLAARAPAMRTARWVGAGLAAAAAISAALLVRPGDSHAPERAWRPASVWSATAGYVAGGTAMVEIDAQLTRLEQERYYGLPD
jgi:hypothetical protein